jgi:hypothetical protein
MNFDHLDHIEHYGVSGMRWGVRNDRRPKLSESERADLKRRNKEAKKVAKEDFKEFKYLTKNQYGSKNWEKAAQNLEYKINTDPIYSRAIMKQEAKGVAVASVAVTGAAYLFSMGLNAALR